MTLSDIHAPGRHCGTAHVDPAAVLVGLSPLAGAKSYIGAKALASKTELLDDIVEALKKREIMFKKPEISSSVISDINDVMLAVTSNSNATSLETPGTIYGLSSKFKVEVAAKWLANGFRAVSPVGYHTDIHFDAGEDGKWRVLLLRLETSVVHLFLSDPDATDCKEPVDPVDDPCVIDGESICHDTDDEDECEILRSSCHKKFKLAC